MTFILRIRTPNCCSYGCFVFFFVYFFFQGEGVFDHFTQIPWTWGVGASFLMHIPAMGRDPVPVVILHISAAHMRMNYSHEGELVTRLKINPCVSALITLKYVSRAASGEHLRKPSVVTQYLPLCPSSLHPQPTMPPMSRIQQHASAPVQQSIWEHFTLSRHLNLTLISVGHRQLLKHFIEQEQT